MSRRVDSRSDTVSSWTNRRKDLRVIRPAAATAGFLLLLKRLLENWLPLDRRIDPGECFAGCIKKSCHFRAKTIHLSPQGRWVEVFFPT